MSALARFWVVTGSLIVGLAALGSLFISFLFPEQALVLATSEARLVVIVVALVSISAFVWAAVFIDVELTELPEQ
jgi:hypothetical protein